MVGDWNRSGVTLLGLFLPATAQWRLDINGNGTLEDCGIDNCLGTFGQGGHPHCQEMVFFGI